MLYSVIQRANPRDLNAVKKYYAVAQTEKQADLRMIAERISRETNFSTAEVQAAIEAFLLVIPKLLSEGHSVKMGDFGTFSLTLSSQGAETKEEFNASMIKGANLHFRAGKEFAKVIRNVEFSRKPGSK